MKVLFVESYPQVVAGQQRTLLSLLDHCRNREWETVVMLPGEGIYFDELENRNIDTIIAAYPDLLSRYGGEIYRDSWIKKLRTKFATLGYVWSLRKHLKTIEPDVIFCNDLRGLLTVGVAAKTLRIPCVIWDKLDKPHGILDWFQLPLVAANPIISTPVKSKYPAWQRWWYRKRIQIVSNGVDFDKFQQTAAATEVGLREELGISEDAVVIGIVGTVTHRKGHDLLLNAFSQLPTDDHPPHLVIIGDWDNSDADQEFRDELQTQQSRLGLAHVHFLGHRDDVVSLMQQIDMLAIPSRHEGMGQVTVEAMACGKPVVGSKIGGIPEVVVDGETGFLFHLNSQEQFVTALRKLIESPALRTQMGGAGRERARVFFNRAQKMEAICDVIVSVTRD